MMSYYEIPLLAQMLFMALQFITACIGICLLPIVFPKRPLLPKLLLPLGIVLSGGMMIVYSANVRSVKKELPLPELTKWLSEQSVMLPALLLVLVFVVMAAMIYQEYRRRKSRITRGSIKEGLDKISSGLCFFAPNGRVILVNHRMNALCYDLTGQDLQNAKRLWELLQHGHTSGEIQRLTEGEKPSFRFSDGSVWSFACEELDGVFQLVAVDTTQIHNLTEKLTEENCQLEAFNQRLRVYGENADELARSRERLEIKANVHRTLGQALLATRRFLQDDHATADDALELWKRSVMVLHKQARQEEEQPLEQLQKAASATGIRLELKGRLPERKKVYELFIQAAAEALTNALTHAKAKTLYVEFQEEAECYRLTTYNDGALPKGTVTEGGGLSSLRTRTEELGGFMEIAVKPQFILTITIGKGDDEIV